MNLHQASHRQPQAQLQQLRQLFSRQYRDYKQQGVGAGSARLVDLIGVEDKVFAEHRGLPRRSGLLDSR